MRLLAVAGGFALIGLALFDGFNTVVLPRRVRHGPALSNAFYKTTWRLCAAAGRHIENGRRREEFLSIFGPLSLLSLLVLWVAAIVVGFALLQWAAPLELGGRHGHIADALYLSACSIVTIAFREPQNALSRLMIPIEAGFGFAIFGLVVGYLPMLYQSYSGRELRISMLDARAGSPPSAGELLVRQSTNRDNLKRQLADWEEWAAELLEDHLSYPMLAYFRSQHANQSWLGALTAMLDSSSFVMLSSEGELQRQSCLTFAICRHALVDLATVFDAQPKEPPESRLPDHSLDDLIARLKSAHTCLLLDHVWPEALADLRRQYESYAFALSRHFLIALPQWLPDPDHPDNWRATAWNHPGSGFAVSDPFLSKPHRSR